ncbi:hypothetical protein [Wenyingzhuangia aestuarii]|uniref:hypothetical protein n=1 Tax=Wenyingzhuangia aestuarii TaxID=1647582 RepID=UPI0014389DD7|nr:hypothetical protein [Wenyingzhuangia aestuarii]NJB83184.1 hypothetical protein [Wenyingzhuangia aestuarii]
MKFTKSLLAATFAFTAIANAQETPSFSLEGEFRPRTEWFGHGQSKTAANGTEGYVSTSVRAALNATYKTESYTTYLGIQEVFKFGDRPQISATGNGNFRVQEAWADIKLSKTSTFKIGRQPLSYDDQRILGGLGWAQQARTHDAGVFKYSNDGYSLNIGGALNTPNSSIYDTAALFSYREMAFVHANKKYNDFNLSALILANTYQATTENKSTLLTAGLHADYKIDIVTLKANAYIQDGQRVGDVNVKGAYLASLDASIKATDITSISAGAEIISGKKDDSAAFFPLYGTNHAFNGLMDRFYVGNHANAGGLVDLNLGIATKIKGYAVKLKGHHFSEQSQGKDNLGSELDLVVAKKFKGYSLVGGYSQFFEPSEVTGKDTQNWAWLMLVIKPKFL